MALADDEIPTRENCDLTDPEEMFLWQFLDLPGVKGAPLMLTIPQFREISAHQSAAGAMIQCEACGHEKTPQIKWRPIVGHDPTYGSAGQWLPYDAPEDPNSAVREVLTKAGPQVRRAVIDELANLYPDDDTLKGLKERLP